MSALIDDKLADLDRRIDALVRFRDELRQYKAQIDASPAESDVPCAHIAGINTGKWSPPELAEGAPFNTKHPT
ncbi:hypothetical protein D3C87_1950040 [compost metagenome]